MNPALYHVVAIVIIGCLLGAAVSFTYPHVAIDGGWASLIALVAVMLEALGVFVINLITKPRERPKK